MLKTPMVEGTNLYIWNKEKKMFPFLFDSFFFSPSVCIRDVLYICLCPYIRERSNIFDSLSFHHVLSIYLRDGHRQTDRHKREARVAAKGEGVRNMSYSQSTEEDLGWGEKHQGPWMVGSVLKPGVEKGAGGGGRWAAYNFSHCFVHWWNTVLAQDEALGSKVEK